MRCKRQKHVRKAIKSFTPSGGNVNTLDLNEAASFLKMNPEVLRRKARAGQVPGRKAGKCWIFVKEHLADWVSGRYSQTPARTASD